MFRKSGQWSTMVQFPMNFCGGVRNGMLFHTKFHLDQCRL